MARQYCGQLGKRDNCQVAVSLSVATEAASLPIAYRLYLPEAWADDAARRAKAGVPEEVAFRDQAGDRARPDRAALAAGVPPGVVLADAGYGNDTDFRDGVTAAGPAPTSPASSARPACGRRARPLPPKPWSGSGGRPRSCAATRAQAALGQGAGAGLPAGAWRTSPGARALTRRSPRASPPCASGRRTRLPALSEPRPEEWFLTEWPEGESEPTKYWLSTLPETHAWDLVATAKLRWRIERDYEELKQEIGLGHYEGRGWRGFHHHATLCIAAYGFLVAERCRFSPPDWRPRLAAPERPADYRPRNSSRAPRAA